MQLKVTVNGVGYDVEVEVEEEAHAPRGAIFMSGGNCSPPAGDPDVAPPFIGRAPPKLGRRAPPRPPRLPNAFILTSSQSCGSTW